MGYQTAEAMVVRKGFSVEQLRACLDEYSNLDILMVWYSTTPSSAAALKKRSICLDSWFVVCLLAWRPYVRYCGNRCMK